MAITKPSAWSPGNILAAILPLLVILAIAIAAVSLRAQPPVATAADPDFVHALYVVEVDRVVKLNAADGASLFEITDARNGPTASMVSFCSSAPVPPPEPHRREDERNRIDVDADARSIWLALKNRLRRHDLDTGALQLSQNIKSLKKIASDSQGGVWFPNPVLGKLDAAGSEILRRNPLIS
ncbi:MAG: hypothetical protein ACHBNF_00785 [Chromatiales bacterium]